MTKARSTRHAFGLLILSLVVLNWSTRARAACGDGTVDSGETCDDHGTSSGDGCSDGCQIEAGYICTGAPSLCCFSDAARAYNLIGSASIDSNTGEVTLTPDTDAVTGYAWYKQRISFANDFSVRLKLYLGTKDATGADGGSIMFQRTAEGLSKTGSSGIDLGGNFSPLVAVEFDDFYDSPAEGDIMDDHVSIFQTDVRHQIAAAVCMNSACSDFEDGKYHDYFVSWTASTHTITVQIDGDTRLILNNNDIVANYFGGDPNNIIFGFAASTGNLSNLQKFCPSAPVGFTVPRDQDGDGVDDSTDSDDDNDGIPDTSESANVFHGDDPGADHDTDGVPNYQDSDYFRDVLHQAGSCVDNVAPVGACDSVPDEVDADHDGIPNHLDLDSDDDGIYDVVEAGGTDANHDGKKDNCSPDSVTGACSGAPLVPPDSDGDHVPDTRDTDSDNDGILDATECPNPSACADADSDGLPDLIESNVIDTDGDGAVDAHDTDSDGDNDLDGAECARMPCPDTDHDGIPDQLDTDDSGDGGDSDGDGVPDASECPNGLPCADSDGDHIPDYLDKDSDNDGTLDADDANRLEPCSPETAPVACARGDADRDGLTNGVECAQPLHCSDSDGDGTPDYLDLDSDADGYLDASDQDPTDPCMPNAKAVACVSGDTDGDGEPNATDSAPHDACVPNAASAACGSADKDDDGVPNASDSAPNDPCVPNAEAAACPSGDADGDGVRNAIDEDANDGCKPKANAVPCASGDADGDGTLNADDGKPSDPCFPDANALACASGDADRDGIANGGDLKPSDPCFPGANALACATGDSDLDGVINRDDEKANDGCVPDKEALACPFGDADGDGLPNGDECANAISCRDTDQDGKRDYLDADDDGDGIPTIEECSNHAACEDTDADGKPDYLDADDDGDGKPTAEECKDPQDCPDSDGDGRPDYLDADDVAMPPPAVEDSDGDGQPDASECGKKATCLDTDGDGKDDAHDSDDDNDGIRSARELADEKKYGSDIDHDGVPNHLDDDSDGDGIPDSLESGDRNHDHIPDYLQSNQLTLVGGGGATCSASPSQHGAPLGSTLAMLGLSTLWLRKRRRAP